MKKNRKKTIFMVEASLIAALYVCTTFAVSPISFGPLQFRISEALTVLPVLTPAAILGLTIGCIIANIGSPYGIVDIIIGSTATLLAAIFSYLTKNICIKDLPLLSLIFPVIFNAVFVGLELSYLTLDGFYLKEILLIMLSIAVTEAVVCYVIGLPIYIGLRKTYFRKVE